MSLQRYKRRATNVPALKNIVYSRRPRRVELLLLHNEIWPADCMPLDGFLRESKPTMLLRAPQKVRTLGSYDSILQLIRPHNSVPPQIQVNLCSSRPPHAFTHARLHNLEIIFHLLVGTDLVIVRNPRLQVRCLDVNPFVQAMMAELHAISFKIPEIGVLQDIHQALKMQDTEHGATGRQLNSNRRHMQSPKATQQSTRASLNCSEQLVLKHFR